MAANSSEIILENRRFRLRLSTDGRMIGLLDRGSGRDLCAVPGRVPFCSIQWGESGSDAFARDYEAVYTMRKPDHPAMRPYEDVHEVTHLSHSNGRLFAIFGDTGVSATFDLSISEACIALEVASVSGPTVDALTVAALPLTPMDTVAGQLNACYDDTFAACAMALTPKVHCAPDTSQAGQVVLTARCSRQFGMVGEKVALIGCPFSEFKDVIQEVERAFGLPSPRRGGAWARESEEAKRSYMFLQLGEADVDALLDYAKVVPFGMIMINVSSWAETEGHYRVHPENFPDGEESLKRTVDRIHRAGMTAGMHIRCTVARQNDAYVTPVPDLRLVKSRMIPLAEAVDEKADFLPTAIAPVDFPSHRPGETWGARYGRSLQIGEELIAYRGVSLAPPYGFVGCRRGACGTKSARHPAGEPVYHLLEIFNDYICDVHTDIFEEITDRVGGLFNRCGFDMFYFDASERLQGAPWYYKTAIQMAYYERFANRDIFVQSSSHTHYTWHMMARSASADGFRDVKAYLDRRLPGFENYRINFMPLDLGWYAINEHISLGNWEYICNKALGFGCSVSVHTSLKALDAHPQTRQILELIRDYEEARLGGRLSDEDLARLRVPGDPFELIKAARGKWSLRHRQ